MSDLESQLWSIFGETTVPQPTLCFQYFGDYPERVVRSVEEYRQVRSTRRWHRVFYEVQPGVQVVVSTLKEDPELIYGIDSVAYGLIPGYGEFFIRTVALPAFIRRR